MPLIGRRLGRRRPIAALLVVVTIALVAGGCAPLPWQAHRRSGEVTVHSPACRCRFSYPASWFYEAANGDASMARLGVHSYDDSSADHVPIPTTFADIGIDWQSDALGQLYLATTTSHFDPTPPRRLTVSGIPATAYAHWTAPPAQGGVYEEHVYLYVPAYQRDYDVSLTAANPPSNDIGPLHDIFTRVLHSLLIVPPTATP